jgi:starch synthase
MFATAEFSPLVSVGGLASAASGLVSELRRQGVEVDVVLPDYAGAPLDDEATTELDVPAWAGPALVRSGTHPTAGPVHLVHVPGIERPHPYTDASGSGWLDNDARFLAFSRAVASRWRARPADVLHLNDWHTASALAAFAADDQPPTVLSIHNLAHQGTCDGGWLDRIGPRAAHYEWYGACNPFSGGLNLADAIVAVSPTYAAEITTPELGCGLHELLAWRGDALVGIRNGIDTDVWDPARDPHLPVPFDAAHPAGKAASRARLLDRLEWDDAPGPLAVMVTRLVHQKGADLLPSVVPYLATMPMRLAVLGSGDASTATALRDAATAAPDVFRFVEGYDEALSHLMFAGADLFVMPSRFEPCGLTQMQAMRYGTLPVVTDVGGLHDTVADADRAPRTATGWHAPAADPLGVLDALHRAVRGWGNARRRAAMQRRGMTADWSWREPALAHRALYERVAAAARAEGRRGLRSGT